MSYNTCPLCKSTRITRMSSTRTLYCHDCERRIPWKLKDGQKPLIGSNRNLAKPIQS